MSENRIIINKYAPKLPKEADIDFISSLSSENIYIFPGLCDVHVHFREPGFSYKGTVKTESMAAARGGYTAVCAMPNLNPVPDSIENLKTETDIIKRDAAIKVYPYGAITVGEKGEVLSDMYGMADKVVAFSDDGRGVQSEELMKKAMTTAKKTGRIIAAHCEDNSLLSGGYIHNGEYARKNAHKGICSESEWRQIERDVRLAEITGCAYHVCHISCKESVDIIRSAKKRGVDVTCETAPHYLFFDDKDLKEDGKFKMNPPIRALKDKEALLEGIADGTIDMIATDHAPHSAEEKSRGLSGSLFGIVGLETAFPALYTHLVKKKIITLDKLLELMSQNPSKRFNIPIENDYTVWELSKEYKVDVREFLSMGRATPFEGLKLYGKCLLTAVNGKTVWKIKEEI